MIRVCYRSTSRLDQTKKPFMLVTHIVGTMSSNVLKLLIFIFHSLSRCGLVELSCTCVFMVNHLETTQAAAF